MNHKASVGYKAMKTIKTREMAVLRLRGYVLPALLGLIILFTGLQATI